MEGLTIRKESRPSGPKMLSRQLLAILYLFCPWGQNQLHRRALVMRREMSIARRHRDALVPHEQLHRSQVYTTHDEPTGKGMAEGVPSHTLNPDPLQGSIEPPRRVLD